MAGISDGRLLNGLSEQFTPKYESSLVYGVSGRMSARPCLAVARSAVTDCPVAVTCLRAAADGWLASHSSCSSSARSLNELGEYRALATVPVRVASSTTKPSGRVIGEVLRR
jgi:hypothetical protein